MRKSTEPDSVVASEWDASRGVQRSAPGVVSRRAPAGNDANFADSAPLIERIEERALRALAIHGFGDPATSDSTSFRRPTSYELHRAARANLSLVLGEISVTVIRYLARSFVGHERASAGEGGAIGRRRGSPASK